ncbi:Os04g0483700 [Oryza sativa Japonica Group]|uniref:Os04g0483700 protein n=1 Tax=Oryza sativa subsp. japonica TaxID=39947 RepID=C7J1P5_ORYSJ|nr:Os04g0483700 [Oryza sativa Japonica Group]|eukprot:NP_001173991.1 Os04g0483700 [Oryza sativa Japonica Group]
MEPEREEALQVCEAARGHLVDSRLADERRWSATVSSPSSSPPDKRRIWLRGHRKQIIGDYLIEARAAFAAAAPLNGECGDHSAATTALGLVEAVLELSPRMEAALELRACSLLAFRRYRGVADMLRDYIPSCTKPTCFLCCFDISNLKHRVLADGEAAAHRRRTVVGNEYAAASGSVADKYSVTRALALAGSPQVWFRFRNQNYRQAGFLLLFRP